MFCCDIYLVLNRSVWYTKDVLSRDVLLALLIYISMSNLGKRYLNIVSILSADWGLYADIVP